MNSLGLDEIQREQLPAWPRAEDSAPGRGRQTWDTAGAAPLPTCLLARGSEPVLPPPAAPPDAGAKRSTLNRPSQFSPVPLPSRERESGESDSGGLEEKGRMVGRACRSRRSFTHEIRPARGSKGPLLGEGGENGTQILSPARYDCFSRRAYGVVLKKKINRIFKKSYPSFTPLCWHVVRCSHRSLRGEILTASPPEPPPPPRRHRRGRRAPPPPSLPAQGGCSPPGERRLRHRLSGARRLPSLECELFSGTSGHI